MTTITTLELDVGISPVIIVLDVPVVEEIL